MVILVGVVVELAEMQRLVKQVMVVSVVEEAVDIPAIGIRVMEGLAVEGEVLLVVLLGMG